MCPTARSAALTGLIRTSNISSLSQCVWLLQAPHQAQISILFSRFRGVRLALNILRGEQPQSLSTLYKGVWGCLDISWIGGFNRIVAFIPASQEAGFSASRFSVNNKPLLAWDSRGHQKIKFAACLYLLIYCHLCRVNKKNPPVTVGFLRSNK